MMADYTIKLGESSPPSVHFWLEDRGDYLALMAKAEDGGRQNLLFVNKQGAVELRKLQEPNLCALLGLKAGAPLSVVAEK